MGKSAARMGIDSARIGVELSMLNAASERNGNEYCQYCETNHDEASLTKTQTSRGAWMWV